MVLGEDCDGDEIVTDRELARSEGASGAERGALGSFLTNRFKCLPNVVIRDAGNLNVLR
jgi:hypothetical protein